LGFTFFWPTLYISYIPPPPVATPLEPTPHTLSVSLCSIEQKKLVLCIIFIAVMLINCNLAYAFST